MGRRLISVFKNYIYKNILISLLVATFLGGGVGLFVAGKRTTDECFSVENKTISGSSVPEKIIVDLSGAVSKPGVYELDAGSRVGDLISAGGGVTGESSANWVSLNVNLSKKLEDSSKVYIPFEWEIYNPEKYDLLPTNAPKNSSGGSSNNTNEDTEEDSGNNNTGGKVNVNTATSSDLDNLPGIGSAYAEKIISARPYTDLKDFEARSGLWKSTVSGIQNLIAF